MTNRCFSCHGEFHEIDEPVHRYMKSSSGCWAVFGEVLAREYSEPSLFEVHRLTVDSYAVQHPGSTDRQSIQSVGVHLIRLCLFLERGLAAENANDAMLKAGKNKASFYWLEPPSDPGSITVADVAKSNSIEERIATVKAWGQSAWEAWSIHHDVIRSWIPNDLKFK